jgi:uncharacterized sporulation protein YeaH/YhbH (DUF444 family)
LLNFNDGKTQNEREFSEFLKSRIKGVMVDEVKTRMLLNVNLKTEEVHINHGEGAKGLRRSVPADQRYEKAVH